MANQNYYTNPAFCQQSEFYNRSPQKKQTPRQSPIGANVYSVCEVKQDYEEQEFYEEMLVDDSGKVKRKNMVVVRSPSMDKRNGNVPRVIPTSTGNYRYQDVSGSRYEEIEENGNEDSDGFADEYTEQTARQLKNRYEYIAVPQESSPPRQFVDTNAIKEGYALVRKKDRYELLPLEKISDTYRYNQTSQPNRYEYINETTNQGSRYEVMENANYQKTLSPQSQRRGNPIATQKLHEFLTTPKKQNSIPNTPQKLASPRSPRKTSTPVTRDPFVTPPKRPTPRAQQKLNYALGTRQIVQEKRSTAVIAPICSSPVQSVYNESFSNKSQSWMNLSMQKSPVQATLAGAALMMILCGGVTCGLCLYMMSVLGRLYYLDFGIVAGFTCFLLGLLGFRSRNCYWLPNRNFISGKTNIEVVK